MVSSNRPENGTNPNDSIAAGSIPALTAKIKVIEKIDNICLKNM